MLNKSVLTIVLSILISVHSQQQQPTSSWTSNAEQLKRWSETIHFTTMQQTLNGYPSLKQNMKIDNFVDLIQAGGCSNGLELARFAIVDKKFYFYINSQMPQFYRKERIINFYKFLDAVSHQYKIPDMYFAIYFEDEILPQKVYNGTYDTCKQIPLFMYHKNVQNQLEKNKFLLPDPLITNVTWLQTVKKIKQISQNLGWEQKDQKLYFRDLATNPESLNSDKFVSEQDFFKYYHRGAFVLLSLKHPDAIDARFIKGKSWLSEATQKRAGENIQVFGQQTSFEQHLKYRYILAADGSGVSWKKIPIALFSNSILFKPESSKIQWFYHQLIPGTHFIQIKQDLSDLLQKQQKMNENIPKAKQIIGNSNQIAEKHLTYRSIISYTLNSLKKYGSYQNLTLTKTQKQRIFQGKDIHEVILWRRKRPYFILFQAFLLVSILMIATIIKRQRDEKKYEEKQKLKQAQSEISIKQEVYSKQ